MSDDSRDPAEVRHRMMVKLQADCRLFGLTRDERLELAEQVVFRRDNEPAITSFNDLSDSELSLMLDVVHGASLIAHLCAEKRNRANRKATP